MMGRTVSERFNRKYFLFLCYSVKGGKSCEFLAAVYDKKFHNSQIDWTTQNSTWNRWIISADIKTINWYQDLSIKIISSTMLFVSTARLWWTIILYRVQQGCRFIEGSWLQDYSYYFTNVTRTLPQGLADNETWISKSCRS